MIHWTDFNIAWSESRKALFRRDFCAHGEVRNGRCVGFGSGPDDDEPCEPCIACDKHEFWEDGDEV